MEWGSLAIRRSTRCCRAAGHSASLVLALALPFALGQNSSRAVSGSVVDASTGQPVGHALVRLGQRAMLTDPEGHFTFQRVEQSQVAASAMKPGFSFTQAPGDPTEISIQPDTLVNPLVLRLYPEALLLGTVTDANGAPIRNLAVSAMRVVNQEDGRRWLMEGVAHTNARGQFRLGVPAGDYNVETKYLKLSPRQALLPTGAPETAGEHALVLHSGDQVSADLHPVSAPLVDVVARVDGESVKDISQLNAVSESGRRFSVPFSPSGTAEIQMTLPAGIYTLEVKHHGFGGDGSDLANINVTQPEASPLAVALHFAPVAPVPVEIRIDDASMAAATGNGRGQYVPSATSLGLSLEPLNSSSNSTESLRPVQRSNDASFVAPAGRYRLRARASGGWYVVSAISGGNDLFSHELLVAAGAASLPIQLVVSNQMASVKGTLMVNGQGAQGWIYLRAMYPSATPLRTLRSGVDGTYSIASLPPGTYDAYALSRRYLFDPYDPDALASYSNHMAPVTVQAGEQAKVDLELVTDAEMKP